MLFVTKWIATALLSRWFGYGGITAATSLALIAFALSMLIFLTFRAGLDSKRRFMLVLVRLILAGLAASLVASYAGGWLPDYLQTVARLNVFLKLAVSSVIIGLCYLLLVYVSGLGYLLRDSVSLRRGEAPIPD
jgi:peptidoglycan biosynthesis protein MviN/MurJ (putative lipid II flippase)